MAGALTRRARGPDPGASLAGRWRESGGTSEVLAFTDDASPHATDLSALLNDPSKVGVISLPNAHRSLLQLRDAVPGLPGATDGLAGWDPDVKADCVVVHDLPGHEKEFRATLTALCPDIRVEEGERPVAT
jgi:hypothetical protein